MSRWIREWFLLSVLMVLGAGMLFVFDQPGRYPFWMKNMKISLDIFWMNDDLEVVHLDR